MHAGTAHGTAFQFHGVKDGHRVHQTRSGGIPFDLSEGGFRHFIRPFEGNGILGEFGGSAKAPAIGNAVEGHHQTIGGNVVFFDSVTEVFDFCSNGFRRYHHVFHHIKAKACQPVHVFRLAVGNFHACCAHQRKGKKFHITLRRNFAVQLAHGAAAEVTGIFVLFVLAQCFIDAIKLAVRDDALAPQHQFPLEGDGNGQVREYLGIVCHIFADLTIPTSDRLLQCAVIIFQNDGQPIQFPAEDTFSIPKEGRQFCRFLGLIQRKDGAFMFYLHQIAENGVAHLLGRTVG